MAENPLVGIIMGSKSDLPVMQACIDQLEDFGVPYELVIASAHRNPAKVHDWASTAADRGMKVIVAAETIPGTVIGTMVLKKTWTGEAPKSAAASIWLLSSLSIVL